MTIKIYSVNFWWPLDKITKPEEAYLNINANGYGKYYLPRLTFNNEKNRQIEN